MVGLVLRVHAVDHPVGGRVVGVEFLVSPEGNRAVDGPYVSGGRSLPFS